MKPLEINPNNRKYYTDDFCKGYELGCRQQVEADRKCVERICGGIEQMTRTFTAPEITKLLDVLIGKVEAVGESHVDERSE